MPSLEESYLEYISTKFFTGNVRPPRYYWTFIGRFTRDNYPFKNIEIVKGLLQRKDVIKDLGEGALDKDSKGITKFEEHFEVNLSNVIDKICSAFPGEVERGEKRSGRKPSNIKSPWHSIYAWLWGIKYDRWLQDHIWKIWKDEARKNTEWMQFREFSEAIPSDSGAIPRELRLRKLEKDIPKNTPLNLIINLDRLGSYLILFNRGLDGQQNKAKFLITPSQAYMFSHQLLEKPTSLPLPGAREDEGFSFKTNGIEEFMGIIIDQELDLDWLKNPDYCFEWKGENLEQVWEQLQQTDRDNWQVFYRDFNVV